MTFVNSINDVLMPLMLLLLLLVFVIGDDVVV